MGKKMFTPDQIIEALVETKGFVYQAAKLLKTSGTTIRNYVNEYSEIKEALDNIRGERTDIVEGILWAAIMRGEKWAVMLYLKSHAKDRGYSENYTPKDGADAKVTIEYKKDWA